MKRTPRLWLRPVLLLIGMVAFMMGLNHFATSVDGPMVWLQVTGDADSGLVQLRYLLIGAAFTAAGLPRQAVAFVAGVSFGFWPGLLIALTATTIGSTLAYLVAATILRRGLTPRFGATLDTVRRWFDRRTLLKVIGVRSLPVGSNLGFNLLSGVAGISLVQFIAGSAAGFLPQTVVFSLSGAGVRLESWWALVSSLLLLLLTLFTGWWLSSRLPMLPTRSDRTA